VSAGLVGKQRGASPPASGWFGTDLEVEEDRRWTDRTGRVNDG
jgi:hypothetical protein